ncbi:MAG: hypothetical protein VW405_03300 [Rhodospirillaceae bacterium]
MAHSRWNVAERHASMNDISFRSPMSKRPSWSKQQAASLPSQVMRHSVNTDQHGNGSRMAPAQPTFPATCLVPRAPELIGRRRGSRKGETRISTSGQKRYQKCQ